MRMLAFCAGTLLLMAPFAATQASQAAPASAKTAPAAATPSPLQAMFADKVKAEWEAFKNKDKKAYSDLLADDFIAVEDDNQGQRDKTKAAAEIDRSVINAYNVFALKVVPLNPNAALVTYELTMLFPVKAQVRFKKVLICELWVKRDGQWKELYYQETHAR